MRINRVVLAVLVGLFCVSSMQTMAQSQMALPFNNAIFQSSWENAAVRPIYRYSLGLPVISSVEFGLVNNGFALKDVTQYQGGKLKIISKLLVEQVEKHKVNMEYVEVSVDLFHFRWQYNNWFYWVAARTNVNQAFAYAPDMVKLALYGNKYFKNKIIDLTATGLDLNAYHEFTFGLSWQNDNWVFGGRVSLLMGLMNAHLDSKEIKVEVDPKDGILYAHEGKISARLKTSGVPTDEKGYPSADRLKSAKFWKEDMNYFNFRNPGAALSFAVSWRPERNTDITLAVSDLGFISWGDSLASYRMKNENISITGVNGLQNLLLNGELDFKQELKNFKKSFDVERTPTDRYMSWLAPKMHFLVTYKLAKQTIAGVSFSGIYNREFYPSVTLSLQQGISNMFWAQLTASWNQRTIMNFGGALIFSPGPFQLYVVTDNLFGIIAPKSLTATNVRVGLNLVFGELLPNQTLTYR